MDLMETLLSWNCLLLLWGIFCFIWYKNNKNLPPGPWGLPLVGYIPFMRGTNPPKQMASLAKNYGNVMRIKLGSATFIVLSDLETIKDAFGKSNSFSFRPYHIYKKFGISKQFAITDGEEFKQHRLFVLSNIKNFNSGKLNQESKITDEIDIAVNKLLEHNGKPIDPKEILSLSIANIIHVFLYGYRFEHSDAEFKQLIDLHEIATNIAGVTGIRICFPWLQPLMSLFKFGSDIIKLNRDLECIVKNMVKNHLSNFISGNRNDYVDAYTEERNETIRRRGTEGVFTENMLVTNTILLFYTGFDTTTKSLLWGFLFLMKHPDVQKKVHAEIQNVIGNDRYPSVSDRPLLPYTEATIMEIHRYATLVPFAVVHTNKAESTINGYTIPKGSLVVSNLWSVHNDKEVWKDPEVFRPERFIDENGELKRSEYLVPFGIGKRTCVGEIHAQTILFLYFTTLLQKFTLKAVDEVDLTAECDFHIVLGPKPFNVSFEPVKI